MRHHPPIPKNYLILLLKIDLQIKANEIRYFYQLMCGFDFFTSLFEHPVRMNIDTTNSIFSLFKLLFRLFFLSFLCLSFLVLRATIPLYRNKSDHITLNVSAIKCQFKQMC